MTSHTEYTTLNTEQHTGSSIITYTNQGHTEGNGDTNKQNNNGQMMSSSTVPASSSSASYSHLTDVVLDTPLPSHHDLLHSTPYSLNIPTLENTQIQHKQQTVMPYSNYQHPSTPVAYHSYPHLQFRLSPAFIQLCQTELTRLAADQAACIEASFSSSSSVPLPSSSSSPPCAPLPPSCHFHVSFRAMHARDIPLVARLHDLLFPVKYEQRFYLDLLLPDRITLLAFVEVEMDPAVIDACTGLLLPPPLSQPVLIGLANGKAKEIHAQCRSRSWAGYVTTIGVEPAFRKMGLGRFLLLSLIRMIRESESRCDSIYLHVKEDNLSAIDLYYSCGFQLSARLIGHYHIDGSDHNALKLVKYVNNKRSVYEEEDEEEAALDAGEGTQMRKRRTQHTQAKWGCHIM